MPNDGVLIYPSFIRLQFLDLLALSRSSRSGLVILTLLDLSRSSRSSLVIPTLLVCLLSWWFIVGWDVLLAWPVEAQVLGHDIISFLNSFRPEKIW